MRGGSQFVYLSPGSPLTPCYSVSLLQVQNDPLAVMQAAAAAATKVHLQLSLSAFRLPVSVNPSPGHARHADPRGGPVIDILII